MRYFINKFRVRTVRSIALYALMMILGILSGCDRVRTTSQKIIIQVKNDKGLPATEVKVRMKESWESWKTWLPGEIKKENEAFYRERWESEFVPWLEASTDAQGKATLKYVVTAIDETTGDIPPTRRDWIANREYIVQIKSDDREDQVNVEMTPGTTSTGQHFTLDIEAIEDPEYVQDNGW